MKNEELDIIVDKLSSILKKYVDIKMKKYAKLIYKTLKDDLNKEKRISKKLGEKFGIDDSEIPTQLFEKEEQQKTSSDDGIDYSNISKMLSEMRTKNVMGDFNKFIPSAMSQNPIPSLQQSKQITTPDTIDYTEFIKKVDAKDKMKGYK